MSKYDVSDPEERKRVLESLLLLNPTLYIVRMLGVAVWEGLSSAMFNTVDQEIKAQKEAVIEIIKTGKEQGVDELEVTMSQKAGIGLDLSGIDGISVDTTFGTSAKMTMKVKYK
jgi:hypothetical protein